MPLSLIEPQKIVDDSSNYTVNTDMQFTMNSENNLVLEYEILREDITKIGQIVRVNFQEELKL